MRLWMTEEIQADVDDAFTEIRKEIEHTTNAWLKLEDYGEGIEKWTFISIVLPKNDRFLDEVQRYTKRTRIAEFRLYVSHESFKKGDKPKQLKLVCQALVRSLKLMADMKIPSFDQKRLLADFERHAINNGWL